jgi:hypothetical protein
MPLNRDVNLLPRYADLFGGRSTVLFRDSANAVATVCFDISPLLRRIILVGKPPASHQPRYPDAGLPWLSCGEDSISSWSQ